MQKCLWNLCTNKSEFESQTAFILSEKCISHQCPSFMHIKLNHTSTYMFPKQNIWLMNMIMQFKWANSCGSPTNAFKLITKSDLQIIIYELHLIRQFQLHDDYTFSIWNKHLIVVLEKCFPHPTHNNSVNIHKRISFSA